MLCILNNVWYQNNKNIKRRDMLSLIMVGFLSNSNDVKIIQLPQYTCYTVFVPCIYDRHGHVCEGPLLFKIGIWYCLYIFPPFRLILGGNGCRQTSNRTRIDFHRYFALILRWHIMKSVDIEKKLYEKIIDRISNLQNIDEHWNRIVHWM